MSKLRDAIDALYVEAGKGYVSLLDDVRQQVVEEGWFGRSLTSSLDAGIHGPLAEPSGSALDAPSPTADLYGRMPEAAEARSWLDVPEEERSAILDLYRGHAARGTETALEMENALDGEFPDWFAAPGEHTQKTEEEERQRDAPSIDEMER